jgi:hypothetical protein
MTCSTHQCYLGDQIKKNKMSGVCGTYKGEESCIQGLVGKPEEKNVSILLAHFQNCMKWLLDLSCLSVCMEQLGSHWMDFH